MIEFDGPSRRYGYETKTSIQFARYLAFNRWTDTGDQIPLSRQSPRAGVDSAPHQVADAALTFSGWRGLSITTMVTRCCSAS